MEINNKRIGTYQMSPCCNNKLNIKREDSAVICFECSKCHSMWVEYKSNNSSMKPWESPNIDQMFIASLKVRRKNQADRIITKYENVLTQGSILDYSCGTGVFLEKLLAQGFDAYGCDIQSPEENNNDRILLIRESWGLPDIIKNGGFKTLIMLDVLEHIPNPEVFIQRIFKETTIDNLLIKVPLLTGPIGFIARLFSQFGQSTLMDKLLLVGDVSPHVSFFTSEGLINLIERCQFKFESRLNLPEVGSEIVDRIRSDNMSLKNSVLVRPTLALGGQFLAGISPIWADTACFHFTRNG